MSDDELIYRRTFLAPRELVWRCLTEPAELSEYWGPRGVTTPLEGIVVELRVGGRFETLMVGDHGSDRMAATFTEVVPPERLPGSTRPAGCTPPAPCATSAKAAPR